MNLRIALAATATFVLTACGSSEDASTEAEADTVEIPADEALQGVDEEPVEDPAAMESDPVTTAGDGAAAEAEAASVQEAGDNAAATAEAAMDAMSEDDFEN
ncbi:hypothetical protein P8R33_11870 [Qipengyuania sp. XHP0211]|uniref:hypothetical protein n=1 Tax=Qipengyuania sp. XHP0211 TaxID=3038079 RepID=UPI00241F7543|nr:hypothetical protein [Qipengyuania sp. XHP0211]MDG5751807.1 hypothetical protein [Qipengyuania sp. XHP0211]